MSTQSNNNNGGKPMSINMPNQSKPDDKQDKKEALERQLLQQQLAEFDAYGFYERLTDWAHTSQKVAGKVPIGKGDLFDVRLLSRHSMYLLRLLRAIDHKGLECPFIHTGNKDNVEKATKKCRELLEDAKQFKSKNGFLNRLKGLLHHLHLMRASKEIEYFKARLEALLVFYRHQEFSRELSQLHQVMFYRNLEEKPAQSSTKPKKASRSRK